jgi:hypothetical protein
MVAQLVEALSYNLEGHSASKRNEYQKMFLGSTAWPKHKADSLTAICLLIV